MSMPIMQAAASKTSSMTPNLTLLRRFRARVMKDADSTAAVGVFGTRTSVFVSSIADMVNGVVPKDACGGPPALPVWETLLAASRMISQRSLRGKLLFVHSFGGPL